MAWVALFKLIVSTIVLGKCLLEQQRPERLVIAWLGKGSSFTSLLNRDGVVNHDFGRDPEWIECDGIYAILFKIFGLEKALYPAWNLSHRGERSNDPAVANIALNYVIRGDTFAAPK